MRIVFLSVGFIYLFLPAPICTHRDVILSAPFSYAQAAIVTFFITRKLFARQLEKNPPVNEAMIRAMMTHMGRTPSEKQVRAVMRSMNEAKGK